jgi:uncharacterized protein (TIGR00725 family)
MTSVGVRRRGVVAVIGHGTASRRAAAEARAVGRLVVEHGWRLVTGGLGGVMQAASRGAHEAPTYREGDVIGVLPGPDASAANRWVDVAVPTNLGCARNTLVVAMADAVIAIGGGAGTLTEMAMAWQLGKPLVALRLEGWSGELAGRAIDGRDRAPVAAASDAAAAIAEVGRALSPRSRGRGR